MPRGQIYPYLHKNLDPHKKIEQIWQDIQAYTGERFPDDKPEFKALTNLLVVIPPLKFQNKFIKGLYISNGVDCVNQLYPQSKDIFLSAATAMWSSYPWAGSADIYLTSFDYPERLNWYKKTYPQNADKIFIPLMDTDFTNESAIRQIPETKKDIDILTVCRLSPEKNLLMLIKALVIFESKYGYIPKTTIITGCSEDAFNNTSKAVIHEMIQITGSLETLKKYVTFIGMIPHDKTLFKYYSRAKCCILTSVFEGKNRMIYESLYCNTPVIVFKDLCKYTRGTNPIMPEKCGLYADFTPESLSDKIKDLLDSYETFSPSQIFRKQHGRLIAANEMIKRIQYYQENLPNIEKSSLEENSWLNRAMLENYQLSYTDFLYGANLFLQETTINNSNNLLMDFYLDNCKEQS